jgi:hypothetical protein
MPSKSRNPKPSVHLDSGFNKSDNFDATMRKLVMVPKAELDGEIKKEQAKKSKRRGK